MIRPIRQLGDLILKMRARTLAPDDLSSDAIRALVADMQETLSESGGVGLAAPQVGESVRLILAGSFPSPRCTDRPLVPTEVLVNPHVLWASEEVTADWEGCLSFLQYRVRVNRPVSIRVAYLRMDGTDSEVAVSGFYARVLQHEIDHLDGILTLDRAASPEDIEEVGKPSGT